MFGKIKLTSVKHIRFRIQNAICYNNVTGRRDAGKYNGESSLSLSRHHRRETRSQSHCLPFETIRLQVTRRRKPRERFIIRFFGKKSSWFSTIVRFEKILIVIYSKGLEQDGSDFQFRKIAVQNRFSNITRFIAYKIPPNYFNATSTVPAIVPFSCYLLSTHDSNRFDLFEYRSNNNKKKKNPNVTHCDW